MLKKQTVNEDKIQKSKVQAEQSKPQSKDRKMSRGEILKKRITGILGSIVFLLVFFCFAGSSQRRPYALHSETDRLCGR